MNLSIVVLIVAVFCLDTTCAQEEETGLMCYSCTNGRSNNFCNRQAIRCKAGESCLVSLTVSGTGHTSNIAKGCVATCNPSRRRRSCGSPGCNYCCSTDLCNIGLTRSSNARLTRLRSIVESNSSNSVDGENNVRRSDAGNSHMVNDDMGSSMDGADKSEMGNTASQETQEDSQTRRNSRRGGRNRSRSNARTRSRSNTRNRSRSRSQQGNRQSDSSAENDSNETTSNRRTARNRNNRTRNRNNASTRRNNSRSRTNNSRSRTNNNRQRSRRRNRNRNHNRNRNSRQSEEDEVEETNQVQESPGETESIALEQSQNSLNNNMNSETKGMADKQAQEADETTKESMSIRRESGFLNQVLSNLEITTLPTLTGMVKSTFTLVSSDVVQSEQSSVVNITRVLVNMGDIIEDDIKMAEIMIKTKGIYVFHVTSVAASSGQMATPLVLLRNETVVMETGQDIGPSVSSNHVGLGHVTLSLDKYDVIRLLTAPTGGIRLGTFSSPSEVTFTGFLLNAF